MTQEEVAERLAIGNEAVSRMERGIVMPNIARLVELAGIFECEAAELLTEASTVPSDQANRICQLLEPLSHDDRQIIMEWMTRFAERLSRV